MTFDFSSLIGTKVQIPGHFPTPISVEAVKSIGTAVLLQVRTSEGRLEETVLTNEEIEKLLKQISQQQKLCGTRSNPIMNFCHPYKIRRKSLEIW
jgi:hypothetical protein